MTRPVRIGGGSAGLGDGIVAIPQLLRGGELDYLMLDYLSEYFMPRPGAADSAIRKPVTSRASPTRSSPWPGTISPARR